MDMNNRVEMIASAIRRYLAGHPQAADTRDGIHRWWIDWGDEEESPELTAQALQLLADRGQMECVEIANRRVWHARRASG